MFKLKHLLRTDDAGQQAGGAQPSQTNQPTKTAPAPAFDVQAEIARALADQRAEFAAQLEKATGHKDIKSLTEAQLKQQGKLQELADANAAEAKSYKTKFEQLAVSHALLSASADAVDPAIVAELLAGKAHVDDAGNVTIDSKPVGDAVKALLDAKPFLAKAQGGTGSGAPANAGSGEKNPWAKGSFNLTEQLRIAKENPAKAAQLKAAAGQ